MILAAAGLGWVWCYVLRLKRKLTREAADGTLEEQLHRVFGSPSAETDALMPAQVQTDGCWLA